MNICNPCAADGDFVAEVKPTQPHLTTGSTEDTSTKGSNPEMLIDQGEQFPPQPHEGASAMVFEVKYVYPGERVAARKVFPSRVHHLLQRREVQACLFW